MASNYSSDPNNIAPVSNSAQMQSGSKSDAPGHSQTPPSSAGLPNTGGSGNQNQLVPGTTLSAGRYRIEHAIAKGGMGAVYKAVDTRFNRPCAVKEMLDAFQTQEERAQALEWFSREATLLLELNHPCIPRVRDFFDENGKNYLVMDLISGRTLGDVLARDEGVRGVNGARGVTEERARSWTRQICSVLSYLHNQSPPIIFRDLKPANIMVTDKDEVKLIDFGIARPFQNQTQSTVILTLGYAPPEQLHGMAEPRSDLYALGATIHRLLTSHEASNNKPNIFSFPPLRTLRPDLSPQFEQVILRALAPNLDHRWQSAQEMERAMINLPPITVVPVVGGVSSPQHNPISGARSTGGVPSGPHSGPPATTTTGPAGRYILDALTAINANPSRVEQAYNAISLAHTSEPNNSLVHRVFGQVFARRQPAQIDAALQAYNRSLQINPNDSETHKLIGDVWLFLRNHPAQAIPAYLQAVRLRANDYEAHERLAQCYEKTHQAEQAMRAYQEAVRHVPTQQSALRLSIYQRLGIIAWRINQLRAAEEAFVQILVINPADYDARFMLSQIYDRQGKHKEALVQCEFVINHLGHRPEVAQLYHRLKAQVGH